MLSQVRLLVDAIHSSIASPLQNPVASGLLLAMATLLALIVVLAALALLEPKRRKVVKVRRYRRVPGADAGESFDDAAPSSLAEHDEPLALVPLGGGEAALSAEAVVPAGVPPRSRAAARVVVRLTVPILILVSVVMGYVITGSDEYCARTCHVNQDVVVQADLVGHAACVACHELPGLAAVPQNLLSRAAMIVGQATGNKAEGALVDARSCTRCHRTVLRSTTLSPSGVKMSHAEPDAVGIGCTACHEATGHSRGSAISMSKCIVCHDAEKASAACATCHTTNPLAVVSGESTATLGSGSVTYPLVELKPACGGCHDQVKQCDACHGLRMPHPSAFVKGGHARSAAFEGKKLCWRCHATADCSRCHGPFTAHGTYWKVKHQAYGWDSPCACHAQKSGIPTCYECHSRTPPHALLN